MSAVPLHPRTEGSFDALILGAAGYGGGELLRLLMDHPQAASVTAVSRSHAGKPFTTAHPGLEGFLEGGFKGEPDWAALASSECPVVFSAQPHGDLARQLPELEAAWGVVGLGQRLTLVDLSGDFRLDDPATFETAYGGPHPCPERLPDFVYAVPEVLGRRLEGCRRLANPGCFATALNLALLPLAGLGLGFVAVSGATGSSGSGAKASEGTHHPGRALDFRAYKVLDHQHESEVRGLLARQGWADLRLAFVPQSAPLVRGIFLTAQVEVPLEIDLQDRFRTFYADAPLVRLVAGTPRVASVAGTALAQIAVHQKDGLAAILVALDNLGKGMAGQAIQNLNLALGLPERLGLDRPGRWVG